MNGGRSSGIIIQYRVFVTPPIPADSFVSRTTDYQMHHGFVAGVNYTFYVVAENSFYASEPSRSFTLLFDGSALIEAVSNLRAATVDSSSVMLQWDPLANVSGYWLMIRCNNYYASYATMNTTNTSLAATGLSPSTRYTFEVAALRNKFSGPSAAVVAVTTGDDLPAVSGLQATLAKGGEMSAVKLEWQPPKDKRKLKWEYGVYYGASLKDMFAAGVRFRTNDTAFTVKQLEACESYMLDVAVVGPIGFG